MDSKPQIKFYVLAASDKLASHQFVCRLSEKALAQDLRVIVFLSNQAEAEALSQQLWAFKPESFLAHDMEFPSRAGSQSSGSAPIVLTCESAWEEKTANATDYLINLTQTDVLPAGLGCFTRAAEILYQNTACLEAGRARYAIYRQQGYALESHPIEL